MSHRPALLAGLIAALAPLAFATPAAARDSLGLYATWGAFRDPVSPRCYAIAMAEPSAMRRDYQPYAAIGTWPRRGVRNQIHFRLSRRLAPGRPILLTIGDRRFQLTGGGGDAWAANNGDNAAIIAMMRSASTMRVSARDAQGRNFGNSWPLTGAASAMDAASIGCARVD
ncbi:hypothetical protein [Novosphingobium sp. 9U]|uniref:hypothetical protein n=1 Tax=Novosphingobium sp. 9U TaxID=2653158 RepID=UPI0012F38F52|nr:hypothetical protein [Novosphingobium sp. 9U]VWX51878.1 conserved exported hypothetical protein [Novosphingobium sp. 9U]